MTLSRVSPVQALVSRLRLALLLTALSSLTLLAMPTFASAAVTSNPDLQARCGLNVMLVLDESNSIDNTSGATAAVRSGAMAFVRSLKDTGSKVGIVEFNSRARKALAYTTVTAANAAENNNAGSSFYRYLNNDPSSVTPDYNPDEANQPGNNDGGTNWEAALDQVIDANNGTGSWAGNTTDADLVVFFTDGNPTVYTTSGGGINVTFGNFDQDALDEAVPKANTVKSQGSHMFVVGVGDAVNDAASESHIQQISGTDEYSTSPPMNTISNGDYTLIDNFSGLEAALKNLATELCKSSVTITKQVDEADGQGYLPQNGWDFTSNVSVSAGSFTWIQPAGLNPRTATTAGAGTAAFQWKPDTGGATSTIGITETQKPGYTLDSVACLKNNATVAGVQQALSFTLSGLLSTDVVTCTVQNKRDTGTIEVKKTWVGGPSQTTLKIGTTVGGSDKGSQLTDANGTTNQTTGIKTLPTGTYYVSETVVPNYDKTLVCTNKGTEFTPGANDAITLAKGDQVVCTYTNTKKGSIELKKAWVGTPGTTTLKIGTTAGAQDIDFQDTANGLTTGPNSVSPGTYHLSESVLADYDGVLTCTGGTFTAGQTTVGVAAGQTVVCTYTNTRKKGSIELKKAWVGTPGTTTLKIGTTAGAQDIDFQDTANGLTTGPNSVNPGTYHLSETALADYDSVLTCTGGGTFSAANKTVVVDSNQTVVCTYTNTRQQGTVKLIKKLTGSATDRFNLNLGGTPQSTSPGNSTLFGNNDETALLSVNTGPYTVAETAVLPADLNDYTRSLSCINKGNINAPDSDGSITVNKDDAWVCTFTNTKKGKITVKKLTNPVSTDGPFGFTGTAAGAFNLNGGDTKTVSVTPGSYTAIEGANADYDLSAISCNDNDSTGNTGTRTATFQVAAGEDVTCTFTNAKKPKLELVKKLVPADAGGTFNLSATGPTPLSAAGVGHNGTSGAGGTVVTAGNYALGETAAGVTDPDQYTMGAPVCVKRNTQVVVNPATGLNAGDDVVCTWTNTKKGKVTIKKVTNPVSSDGPFGFNGTLAGSFNLNGGGSKTVYVPAGIYTAIEDDPSASGYVLTSLTCDDTASVPSVPNRTVSVNVPSGGDVTCTFTNAKKPKLELVKKLVPADAGGTFNLSATGPTPVSANGVGHNGTSGAGGTAVTAGNYTLGETAAGATDGDQYTMGAPVCVKRNTQIAVNPATGLNAGDDVVCTWTNTKKAKVTIKKVTAPVTSDGPFGFTGGLAGAFNLNGGGSKTVYVVAGSYTVLEDDPSAANYKLDSVSCNDNDSTTDLATRKATVIASSGEDVTCTFTNKKVNAQIHVVKSPATQAVYLTAPSNTATYNYAVTNPGTTPLSNVTVGDDKCASVSLVTKNGDSSPTTLDPGDTWNYTCSISGAALFGVTTAPITNTVTASGKDELNNTITDTDTAQTTVLLPEIKVVKSPGSQSVYGDGTASYTYAVTNPGNTPLASVTLSDDKCAAVTGPNTGLDASPSTLDPGDTWTYSCSVSAVTLFAGGSAPVTNTATAGGTSGGHTVTDTDTAVTNLRSPAIKVVKSPSTQNVYSDGTAAYSYVVTNEGNTPLETVTVSDDKCASVVLDNKGGDASPSQLNPGDTWTYTCSVSAATLFSGGSAPVTNTATAKGTDPTLLREVTDTDTAVTNLLSPAIKVVKSPSTQNVYADGTASYTYVVTNEGNTPLETVTVADDKCASVVLDNKGGDASPSQLNPGDTWTYTCSVSAATLFSGGSAPVTNTATAKGTDPTLLREVTDTDTAETKLLRPEIKVVKTPGAQSVLYSGDATYSYAVTNEGNTPLDTVSVSDDKCPSVTGPNKGADATPDTLDAGDTWTFTCTISAATLFGANPSTSASVTNTATATGKDTIKGRTVTDTDTAVTDLQTGELILEKQLVPSSDPGRFELKHDGTSATVSGTQGTAFGDTDQSNTITVLAGEPVTISESAVSADHPLSDYTTTKSCSRIFNDERVQVDAVTDPLDGDKVTVPANQTIKCTFVNVKKAKITIKKVVSNPEAGAGPQFGFATDLPGGAFNLRHNETTSRLVETGEVSYNVSENDPSGIDGGYKLTGIVCTDDSPTQVTLAERSVSITPSPGDEITCTFTNKRIVGLDVVVKAPKVQSIYGDGTATYTYQVTNTGTSDLTDITVGDDKCPSVTGPNTGTDATPTVLNPGDVWTYTCSISASALFGSTSAPITNTVTVNAKDELGRSTPPAKDTAVTNLLVPGIALAKSVAPASQGATAGAAVTFNITVTNTGNTSMPTVNVSDDLCPANLSAADKAGDASPNTLDPGETWSFTCVVQTTAGQAGSTIVNTASVNGTDTGGKTVTANGNASITLPANPVTGQSKGTARVVASSAGCVKSAYGTAAVTGSNIKQVTFYVNGKLFKRLTKANSGKNYRMQLKAKGLKYGTYKITAKVQFVTGATPASKTLNVQFSRCRPRVVIQPKFTG